jgi:hypothetical protein
MGNAKDIFPGMYAGEAKFLLTDADAASHATFQSAE